jgi:Probable taurine catabolism dioxygenase
MSLAFTADVWHLPAYCARRDVEDDAMMDVSQSGKFTCFDSLAREQLASDELVVQVEDELEQSRIVVIRNFPGLSDDELRMFIHKFGYVRHASPRDVPLHGVRELRGGAGRANPLKDWRLDQACFPQPAKDVLVYCVESSRSPVCAHFCDLQDVLECVPERILRPLRGSSVVYSETMEAELQHKEVEHPLIFQNWRTGRESVYLSERELVRFVGVESALEKELRSTLAGLIAGGDFTTSHSWMRGDIVMFDAAVTLFRCGEGAHGSLPHLKLLNTIFEFSNPRIAHG